jgi:hypothetical protein
MCDLFARIPKPTKGDKIVSSNKNKFSTMAIITVIIAVFLVVAAPSMASTIRARVFGYDFRPVSGWHSTKATWYGPGYVWHKCANGKVLLPAGPKYLEKWRDNRERYVYLGVASLGNHFPLVYNYKSGKGTWIQLKYRGVSLILPVVDTGNNYPGMAWDLTTGTVSYMNWLGKNVPGYAPFGGSKYVQYRLVKKI